MDIELIKIESPIVVKEEQEFDQDGHFQGKLENEEKPQIGTVEKGEHNDDEPLIVVKEELELDQNGDFQVKLENEENPQVVDKEDKSQEPELSTSEIVVKDEVDCDEVNMHTCCYCEVRKKSEEMIQTPKIEREFVKWYRLFGKKMQTEFETLSWTCRDHFNDEFGESRLVDICHEGSIVKTILNENKRCCYCMKLRSNRNLTTVTNDEHVLAEWVEILGKKFYENVQKTDHLFICRNHFDVKWKGQRPESLLPIANKNSVSSEIKKVATSDQRSNGKMLMGRKKTLHICCYCGEGRESEEMVQTPKTAGEFTKWNQFFGGKIIQNSWICRDHFIDEFGDSRLIEVFRGNNGAETKFGKRRKCCYCGKSKMNTSMTAVPNNNKYLLTKWVDILGKEFRECSEKKRDGYICRSHFKTEWVGIRPKNVLPVADLGGNVTEKKPYRSIVPSSESIRPNRFLSCSQPVQFLSNEIKEEVEENSSAGVKISSIDGVKLEEPDTYEDSNEKFNNHFPIQHPTEKKQEGVAIGDGPSDPKRIKIEVKEE